MTHNQLFIAIGLAWCVLFGTATFAYWYRRLRTVVSVWLVSRGGQYRAEVRCAFGRERTYYGRLGDWRAEYTDEQAPGFVATACDLALKRKEAERSE